MKIEHIPAGQFKTHCLQLMNDVHEKKKVFIITKRGAPVAKICPVDQNRPTLFGYLADSIVEVGNITDPLDVTWNAHTTD